MTAGRLVRDVARLKANEVIYKAQIKNLHRLLGQLVHRKPGTQAFTESWLEASKLVIDAHMTEYKPGEVANND
jgi:hypothetical protein